MTNLSNEYEKLKRSREPFLTRAKDYSRMTVKQLLDKDENSKGSEAKTHGYTSLGAKLANHLANKVVQTLFPLGHNFFVPMPNEEIKAEMKAEGVNEKNLAPMMLEVSRQGRELLPSVQDRQTQIEMAKHLIIAGNIGTYYPQKGRCILIPLTDYVVQRDPQQTIIQFIWKQKKAYGKLNSKSRSAYLKAKGTKPKFDDEIDVFTGAILRPSGEYQFIQQISDVTVIDTMLPAYKMPFDALRWSKTVNEDYGHSHVEEHAADLFSYRFLTKCMSKGMALMCDVKFLVRGGETNIEHLMKSDTGEYIAGNMEDIGILQLGKFADYSQVQAVREEFKRELGQAFLMNSAVRRDAERVTTYELRLDAAELESTMGGIYSLLAEEWQKPLARRLLVRINSTLAKHSDSAIVTGLETLGKAGELEKIAQFSQLMQLPASWPQGVQARVKWGDYSQFVSTSIALETPWLMTDEEFAEQQQLQQQAMQEQQMQQGMADAIPTAVQPFAQAAAQGG